MMLCNKAYQFDMMNEKPCELQANLISIDIGLEWAFNFQGQILGLRRCQFRQLSIDMLKVEQRDLLVQDLWQNVDTDFLLSSLAELDILLTKGLVFCLEQHDLSKHLVGERAGHDEG